MRAFQKKNIASFSIFGILVIVAVIAMGFVVVNYVQNDDSKIEVNVNDLIFDDNDRVIEVTKSGSIKKKWDENYYLIDEKNKSENLGTNPIIYDKNNVELKLLGSSYRIYPDGTTVKNNGDISVTNFNESSLYKLSDRTYVMTGKEIYSYVPGFESVNFMRIKLDRNGNGLMQSVGLNKKSISNTVLVSGNLYFDVASEILYCDGIETNLRKVIGSTNMYEDAPVLYTQLGIERPEKSTANKEIPDIEEYNITAGQGGQGGSGGEGGLGGIGGFGGNAGNGGVGGNAGSGGQGGQGGIGGSGGDAPVIRDQDFYSIDIKSITSDVSSITVNYSVYDPQNSYANIYCEITQSGTDDTQRYVLNKYDSTYRIFGLEQNKTYEINILYELYTIVDQKYVAGDTNTLMSTYKTTSEATAELVTTLVSKDVENRATSVKCNLKLSGYNIKTYNENNPNAIYDFEIYKYYDDGSVEVERQKIYDTALQSDGQNFTVDVQDVIKNNMQVSVTGIEVRSITGVSNINGDTDERTVDIQVNYYQGIDNTKEAPVLAVSNYDNDNYELSLRIRGYKLRTNENFENISKFKVVKYYSNVSNPEEETVYLNQSAFIEGQKVLVAKKDVNSNTLTKIVVREIEGYSSIDNVSVVNIPLNFEYICD